MAAIMTGANGSLALWNAAPLGAVRAGSPGQGCLPAVQKLTGFARLSRFAANGNHPPEAAEVNWDAGLQLLFRIAEAPRAV